MASFVSASSSAAAATLLRSAPSASIVGPWAQVQRSLLAAPLRAAAAAVNRSVKVMESKVKKRNKKGAGAGGLPAAIDLEIREAEEYLATDMQGFVMPFFFTMVIALIFGTIFLNLGKKVDMRQDLFNSLGSMYAAVIFIGIQNGQCVQPIVDVERTVFYREKAAGMYSVLPYAFAQVFIEIPYVFLQTLVYGLIVYSLIGLNS